MRINLDAANAQAAQARMLAGRLRDLKIFLRSYQGDLLQHWRGQEMMPVNDTVNDIMSRLSQAASELESLGAGITTSAQSVRRADDLADARSSLARAETATASARRDLDAAQSRHNANPTPATQQALNTARNNLNNAIAAQNNASSSVRALL